MPRFFHHTLRTSDVASARAFYAAVIGDQPLDVVPLHEAAVARGARPHWLSCLDVGDVARVSPLYLAHGASPLGPRFVRPEGIEVEIVRDPGGAIVAISAPRPPAPGAAALAAGPAVAWHILHTKDVAAAKERHAALFGWEFKPPLDLGSDGVFHPFSWEPGGAPVGSLRDLDAHPGVHAQWLVFLRVPSLDAAVTAARARGGAVVNVQTLAGGQRIAVCDDPQGAAFALWQEG